jgi:hypothetical protein
MKKDDPHPLYRVRVDRRSIRPIENLNPDIILHSGPKKSSPLATSRTPFVYGRTSIIDISPPANLQDLFVDIRDPLQPPVTPQEGKPIVMVEKAHWTEGWTFEAGLPSTGFKKEKLKWKYSRGPEIEKFKGRVEEKGKKLGR